MAGCWRDSKPFTSIEQVADEPNQGALNARTLGERIWRLWLRGFWSIAALSLVLFAIGWWLARPAEPDDFYRTGLPVGALPGTLLAAEAFTRGVPSGARGWRIVYTTRGFDGNPRTASGLVVARADAPDLARPVVAWAHGTTGIQPGCAPSILGDPFAFVPAFETAVEAGWAWVAPDYSGLGTSGPHPYLVGPPEAHAVLDAVRAAREIEALSLSDRTVAWGHSQGGHAALWTGIVASDYAPEVDLRGVAAVAPATDLPNLVAGIHDTFMGRMLSAYLVHAYAAVYPDVVIDELLRPIARPLAADIAGRCLTGAEILVSAVPSLIGMPSLFTGRPPVGAFADRLADNVPDRPIEAPVLIAQGSLDTTVLPGVQGGFVGNRCLSGQVIDYRGFDGLDHLSIVGEESPVPALLMEWSRARFDGLPAPSACNIRRN